MSICNLQARPRRHPASGIPQPHLNQSQENKVTRLEPGFGRHVLAGWQVDGNNAASQPCARSRGFTVMPDDGFKVLFAEPRG